MERITTRLLNKTTLVNILLTTGIGFSAISDTMTTESNCYTALTKIQVHNKMP